MEPPDAPPPIPSPPPEPYIIHIGKSGQDALWAAYCIIVLSTLFIAVLTARLHVKHRALHLIALVITGVAALSYYAMATHSGVSYVSRGFKTINGEERLVLRQVFPARYVNWFITGHIYIIGYSLLSGLPWVNVVPLMLSAEGAVLCVMFGALLNSNQTARWGWFGQGCFSTLLMLGVLLGQGRRCAKQQHAHVSRLYTGCALFLIPLALLWSITLVLGDGAGVIDVNTESIAYTVFDLLLYVLLPISLVLGYKFDEEEDHVTCFSEAWTRVRGRGGAIRLDGAN